MSEAKTLDLKKLLMRYRRLKNEANLRDPAFVDRLSKNYFSCVRKSGVLQKRGETSWFGSWENRYVILTNAGLLYFEGKMIQSKGDLKPQNFKPLNDFVVRTCNPKVRSTTLFLKSFYSSLSCIFIVFCFLYVGLWRQEICVPVDFP